MMLPAAKTKNPRIQPIISTTAMIYNKLLIKLFSINKTIAIPKQVALPNNFKIKNENKKEFLHIYRLRKIINQVFCIFNTYTQTDQRITQTIFNSFFSRYGSMCHGSGMIDKRFDTTKTFS